MDHYADFFHSPKQFLAIRSHCLDSTQDEAKRIYAALPNPQIQLPYAVIAEEQTRGRGRTGRTWVSPAGKNIYFSLVFAIPKRWLGPSVHLLSTLAALAIDEALSKLGVQNIQIKWPNDLMIGGKKLAGVLVEILSNEDGQSIAILGAGLNVNLTIDECALLCDRKITSLLAETNHVWNIEKTIDTIIQTILGWLGDEAVLPEAVLRQAIESCSWILGEDVATHRPNGEPICGRALQFTERYELRILNKATGQEEVVSCGLD